MAKKQKDLKKIDTLTIRLHHIDGAILKEWVIGALLTVKEYTGVWTFLPMAKREFKLTNDSKSPLTVLKATIQSETISETIPYRMSINAVHNVVVQPGCDLTLRYEEQTLFSMVS